MRTVPTHRLGCLSFVDILPMISGVHGSLNKDWKLDRCYGPSSIIHWQAEGDWIFTFSSDGRELIPSRKAAGLHSCRPISVKLLGHQFRIFGGDRAILL